MLKSTILSLLPLVSTMAGAADTLIPATPPNQIYNYFCTWAAQGYVYGQDLEHLDWEIVLKGDGRSALTEQHLTEAKDGWLNFYPKIRSDLWFLVDDGYYVVKGQKSEADLKEGMASMEFDTNKFPSCAGHDPAGRIAVVDKIVKQHGWHGLGLWSRYYPKDEAQAREKMNWSKASGIGYWKIDTGDEAMNYCRIRSEMYSGLVLEHAVWARGVYTGKGETNMKEFLPTTWLPERQAFMRGTDVVRIYDCDQPLGQITALLRTAALLADANGDPSVTAIINVEDHLAIAGALGCSVEVLRFPTMGKRPDGDPDIFNAGPRHVKRRMDEVVRTLRWQRLAPPIKANALPVVIDDLGLADTWTITRGDTWNKTLGPVTQAAPARISRGLPLAQVEIQGDAPFVLACRHPEGPLSVTTLGRFANSWGYKIPLANVTLDAGTIPPVIGIFGRYRNLTLRFTEPVTGRKVLAQDIMSDQSIDITQQVQLKGMEMTIPGPLIDQLGLAAATPGDESDPGMVLKILP